MIDANGNVMLTIPTTRQIKIRVKEAVIRNSDTPKRIDWYVSAQPVKEDGSYGTALVNDLASDAFTPEFIAQSAAPAGTLVEVAPGLTRDISGMDAAQVAAWLQWRGQQVCDGRSSYIADKL